MSHWMNFLFFRGEKPSPSTPFWSSSQPWRWQCFHRVELLVRVTSAPPPPRMTYWGGPVNGASFGGAGGGRFGHRAQTPSLCPAIEKKNTWEPRAPFNNSAPLGDIHPRTTPTNTSDRSVCRFGDMCKSARCPWYHPTASGTTRQPQGDAGSDMLPPRRRTPAAVSVPAEKERARAP